MGNNLYWMQCGGCGGDTHSFLNIDQPNILDLFRAFAIQLLWHPTLSNGNPREHQATLDKILNDELPLDVFCVEGTIIRGPGGTGMYDVMHGKPQKDLVAKLARKARIVIAVGTCASFGGIGAEGEIEATGLQFKHAEKGGFLGADFLSGAGLPVRGYPCHS